MDDASTSEAYMQPPMSPKKLLAPQAEYIDTNRLAHPGQRMVRMNDIHD